MTEEKHFVFMSSRTLRDLEESGRVTRASARPGPPPRYAVYRDAEDHEYLVLTDDALDTGVVIPSLSAPDDVVDRVRHRFQDNGWPMPPILGASD